MDGHISSCAWKGNEKYSEFRLLHYIALAVTSTPLTTDQPPSNLIPQAALYSCLEHLTRYDDLFIRSAISMLCVVCMRMAESVGIADEEMTFLLLGKIIYIMLINNILRTIRVSLSADCHDGEEMFTAFN